LVHKIQPRIKELEKAELLKKQSEDEAKGEHRFTVDECEVLLAQAIHNMKERSQLVKAERKVASPVPAVVVDRKMLRDGDSSPVL